MNKYKVEFIQTDKYVIDVLADNEEQARVLAERKFDSVSIDGILHYYQTGDTDFKIDTVYDVTNTDDPFNP